MTRKLRRTATTLPCVPFSLVVAALLRVVAVSSVLLHLTLPLGLPGD